MTQWELTARLVSVLDDKRVNTLFPERIWTLKDKTGTTDWEEICGLAADGWELISITPITQVGLTIYLLYTFKRPIQE